MNNKEGKETPWKRWEKGMNKKERKEERNGKSRKDEQRLKSNNPNLKSGEPKSQTRKTHLQPFLEKWRNCNKCQKLLESKKDPPKMRGRSFVPTVPLFFLEIVPLRYVHVFSYRFFAAINPAIIFNRGCLEENTKSTKRHPLDREA